MWYDCGMSQLELQLNSTENKPTSVYQILVVLVVTADVWLFFLSLYHARR